MDNKLEEIFGTISLSPEDTNKFGNDAFEFIRRNRSGALTNPENNFAYLREFLADEIEFLSKEIEHYRKYSPGVYHENVAISREYKREMYMKILDALERM